MFTVIAVMCQMHTWKACERVEVVRSFETGIVLTEYEGCRLVEAEFRKMARDAGMSVDKFRCKTLFQM
jgi:hypothetical protein